SGMDSNASDVSIPRLDEIHETIDSHRDTFGFLPFQMIISISLSNPSVILFLPISFVYLFIWAETFILLRMGNRGNNMRFVAHLALFAVFSVLMARVSTYNIHSVISALKLSFNGSTLNGNSVYVIFLIVYFISFIAFYVVIYGLAEVMRERNFIYVFSCVLIVCHMLYLEYNFNPNDKST
ncbi:hypothetical protein PFISCL1PPCAC_24539, partial [Pristionchus fissidentatus]